MKKNSKNQRSAKSYGKSKKTKHSILKYELQLLALIAIIVISIFSLHTDSIGIVGEYFKKIIFGLFSKTGYLLPYVVFILVLVKINHNLEEVKMKYTIASITLFFGVLLFVSTLGYDFVEESFFINKINMFSANGIKESYGAGIKLSGGGVIGNFLTFLIVKGLGKLGAYVITVALIGCTVVLGTRVSLTEMIRIKKEKILKDREIKNSKKPVAKTKSVQAKETAAPKETEKNPSLVTRKNKNLKFEDFNSDSYIEKKPSQEKTQEIQVSNFNESENITKPAKESPVDLNSNEAKIIEKTMNEKKNSEHSNYTLPKISLLQKNLKSEKGDNREDVLAKAEILENTLNNFGVDAKVIKVSRGPAITMYELQPSPGVKVSKIVNLSDDIALNLAAHQVRIIAPIPGKAAVGIEVPNDDKSIVKLRDVVDTEEFLKFNSKLKFAIGKDISGNPIVGDLAQMPHLLIAGATGSGKSVCVNTLILSILFNANPDEVKLLMIDPKVVELSNYNGIPHLILPVVTDSKKAAIALNWAVQEMVKRYQMFADNGVKDVKSYNVKVKEKNDENMEKMSQIVVIIDELADLMMVAANQVEDAICRLAQMARAAGIHLIVATQRPSVDVITGVIKANIPSRIAFAVSSQVDSRTILDMSGSGKTSWKRRYALLSCRGIKT